MSEEQTDLFTVDESIGPMAAFIAKHEIKTHHNERMPSTSRPWCAYTGDLEDIFDEDEDSLITGYSEKEVIYEFAKAYKLEGWDKLYWG